METLAIRRLTSAGSWALAPTFSPDGQNLAFVVAEPRGSDLYLLRGRQGTPERLTSDHALITGLTWAPDNRAIFFASNRNGSFEVWQIRPDGTHLDRLSIAADGGLTIDRSGRRLAYSLGSRGLQMHITSIDMHGAPPRSVAIAESTRSEFSATYSADGKKIAFASDRGGNRMDIWIADADGWNPIRLTSFGKGFTGSPRFSPDGEWVAFDAIVDGRHFDIYTGRTGGGEPRRLTSGSSNNSFPCWSRDGRWIYFGSDRTGNEQVWKMRSDGEQPVQITKNGGTGGFESSDGRYLYYSKGNGGPGIWRVAVQSGTEEPVLPSDPVGAYVRDWTLVDNRLYFLKTRDREQQSLEVLDLDTKSVRRVLDLPGAACPSYSPEVAVSPDHRTLLTCFEHPAQSDLMLAENVR
jgi:Tol biopolymer transport system component